MITLNQELKHFDISKLLKIYTSSWNNSMNQKILHAILLLAEEKQPEVRNFRIASAVVFKDKEIVAVGYPRNKSHPIQKEFGRNEESIYLHAEIDAILRAYKHVDFFNKDFSLYVARIKRRHSTDNSFTQGNAKPCSGCTRFIHKCGIQTLHYSTG